jgi:hypothetical protein
LPTPARTPLAVRVGLAALAALAIAAVAGVVVGLANRRALPACARYEVPTARWKAAALFAPPQSPTVRERIAGTLLDCGRLGALTIGDLTLLLGPPPAGVRGHPGGEAWTYPLALLPGSHTGEPPVPRSVLLVDFSGPLVADAVLVRFDRPRGTALGGAQALTRASAPRSSSSAPR